MQWSSLERRFLRQLPNPGNDGARPVRIVNDFRKRVTNLLKVRRSRWPAFSRTLRRGFQQTQTGIGIIYDCSEWLVNLMGNGGGQFAHGAHPADVREIRLHLPQRCRSEEHTSE